MRGVLLLREIDRQIGLISAIDQCLPDPRYIVHSQRSMLALRTFAIAMGYEDLNDHQTLRTDPALQTAADRDPDEARPLPSPPTLCLLENRVSRKALVRMAQVLVDQFLASHSTPPQEIVLDLDATDDTIHGNQVGRFFHGYFDSYCFLPLYVFSGQQLLCAYLRPSNIDAARTWDRQRRVIMKAERMSQGVNNRFVVTNLPNDTQSLYNGCWPMTSAHPLGGPPARPRVASIQRMKNPG